MDTVEIQEVYHLIWRNDQHVNADIAKMDCTKWPKIFLKRSRFTNTNTKHIRGKNTQKFFGACNPSPRINTQLLQVHISTIGHFKNLPNLIMAAIFMEVHGCQNERGTIPAISGLK